MSPVLVETDGRLREWIQALAPEARLSSRPPGRRRSPDTDGTGAGDDDDGAVDDDADEVSVYALGLSPEASPRVDVRRPGPATVWMRYLVCGTHVGSAVALETLDTVLERLLDRPAASDGDLEVELDPQAVTDELWLALAAAPRPALSLRVRARFDRRVDDAQPVLSPLRVLGGPVRALRGRVLGPGDVPLVGAEVTLPATGGRSRTGTTGGFTLPSVPAGPLALAVHAKGRSFTVAVDDSDELLTIRCDPTEATP